MPVIEINTGRRFLGKKIRRVLPTGWKDLDAARRIFIFKTLLSNNNPETARLAALEQLLGLPRAVWLNLAPADISTMLEAIPWLNVAHSAAPIFPEFKHRGRVFHCAADNFENGTCLEFPLAEEFARAFLSTGDATALLNLTATIFREKDADTAAALRRDDIRCPLHSRAEIIERSKKMHGIDDAFQYAGLLYFVGVQSLINRLYGKELFEKNDEPDEPGEKPAADPLGWWGMYLDAADGDPVKLEAIHHSNFHQFCLMEVRRRKQHRDAIQKQKMASSDWGKE
mgnify:CR=1 FL=1